MSAVRSVLRRILPVYVRSRLHFAVVDSRLLGDLYTRFDASKLTRITADTELVIEGCPRSGNSYALAAFRYSNEGVTVASHRHSHTAVRTGLKRRLPVIVIIRRPRDTIGSGLQYYPDQPARWAIKLYQRFHEKLLPMADRVLIATFEEVTSDFGEVVRRCNARFGTNFTPYVRTDESEIALTAMLDKWVLKNFDPKDVPRVSGRPSEARKSADQLLSEANPDLVAQIDELDKLYDAVLLHKSAPLDPGRPFAKCHSPE